MIVHNNKNDIKNCLRIMRLDCALLLYINLMVFILVQNFT